MAKITTITNPLTGQPAQVDQLDHTAQEIDDAIARALPGGAIDTALQNKLGGVESTDYPGCYYRTVDGAVEWFNPPMILGVEYRTTERFNGDPVYAKVVDCGDMPAANSTSQIVWFNDPNYNLNFIVSFHASRGYIGLINNFVVDQNASIVGENIHLKTGGTLYYSGRVFAIVKYTKSAK